MCLSICLPPQIHPRTDTVGRSKPAGAMSCCGPLGHPVWQNAPEASGYFCPALPAAHKAAADACPCSRYHSSIPSLLSGKGPTSVGIEWSGSASCCLRCNSGIRFLCPLRQGSQAPYPHSPEWPFGSRRGSLTPRRSGTRSHHIFSSVFSNFLK